MDYIVVCINEFMDSGKVFHVGERYNVVANFGSGDGGLVLIREDDNLHYFVSMQHFKRLDDIRDGKLEDLLGG